MKGRHDLRVGCRLGWPLESLLFTLYRTLLRTEKRATIGFSGEPRTTGLVLSLADPTWVRLVFFLGNLHSSSTSCLTSSLSGATNSKLELSNRLCSGGLLFASSLLAFKSQEVSEEKQSCSSWDSWDSWDSSLPGRAHHDLTD